MILFTATQLKNETGNVLSSIQKKGIVEIASRSRPNIVMMEKCHYEKLLQLVEEANNDK